jgi:hypothetical protein
MLRRPFLSPLTPCVSRWVEFADKKVAKRVALTLNSQQIGAPARWTLAQQQADCYSVTCRRAQAFCVLLRPVEHQVPAQVQVGPPHRGNRCAKHARETSPSPHPLRVHQPLTSACLCHLCTAYQKAVKEQRLALELSASKRERDFYLTQVDQAKAIAAMSEKRQRKAAQLGADGGDEAEDDVDADGGAAPGKQKKKAKLKAVPLPTARMVRRFVQVRLLPLPVYMMFCCC